MKKNLMILITIFLVGGLVGLGMMLDGASGVLEREVNPSLAATTHNTQQTGISVIGQGRASVTPDMAVLGLGIEAQAETVSETMSQADEAMEAVIDALKAHGVAEKDMQTFHFSIYQAWDWNENRPAGFRVSNMVSARIRALDQVGVIINAAVEAGGDHIRIHGIGFTVEDPAPYHYEAREKAFTDAKAKAEQLAGLAGVTLGKPTFINEGMSHFPAHFPPTPMPPVFELAAAYTPIMPGEQEVVVVVQVVFAIE